MEIPGEGTAKRSRLAQQECGARDPAGVRPTREERPLGGLTLGLRLVRVLGPHLALLAPPASVQVCAIRVSSSFRLCLV